jgi:hypothetical protein
MLTDQAMAVKRLTINNRGLREALRRIEVIMANQEVVNIFKDFLRNVTEGDKMAAAVLTLAAIRMDTGKVIEHMQEETEKGSFAATDFGGHEKT